ncbi:MAG: glycosyltransferase [Synergistaceae bacterium]|nr:glycosyltransferase [Synergistaceae bacterium]
MKILVVGKENIIRWPESSAYFLSLENEVRLFIYNKHTAKYYCHKMLGRRALNNFLAGELRKVINDMRPDMIFYVSSPFLPQELFEISQDYQNMLKVGWVGDECGPRERARFDLLDIVFYGFDFKSDKEYYVTPNTIEDYLPLCANDLIFQNLNMAKTGKPFFVGEASDYRTEYFKACGTSFDIYGHYWDAKALPQHSVHNKYLPIEEANKFINRSVLPINVHCSPNKFFGPNFRLFEIPACGGLILTDERNRLDSLYDIGTEALVYRTPEEMDDIVRAVVSHPSDFRNISKAGYERTMSEHTYSKRMEQMFKLLKEHGLL